MTSIRGSRSYIWDVNKLLGHGATSSVYMGRNKVCKLPFYECIATTLKFVREVGESKRSSNENSLVHLLPLEI